MYSVLPLVTQISGTDSWAISNYNALQASFRRRYSRGLEYLASYTWSKTMTDNLGYYGSAGVAAQGAYSVQQLQPPWAELRSRVFRRHAQHHDVSDL